MADVDMGAALKQREEKYVVTKDEAGTWRILDTWHPSLARMGPDDEISDDSPAVLLVPDGAFVSLVKEAIQLGYIQHATLGNKQPINLDELELLREERDKLRIENATLTTKLETQKEQTPVSEPFRLKSKIVDSLLKLAVSEDLSELK